MTDTMSIRDYLSEGGVLTSPANVPPRYRAELMKIMATFVDSELAGAAGFAEIINDAPGIKERIAAAKIVMEKTDNAGKVLRIMSEFGVDTTRYVNHHPWAERLTRQDDIGTSRVQHDMRLAVFNYPLQGWADAVVMNLIMGAAVGVQLSELSGISYQPLAQAFREIMPIENRHVELAEEGLKGLLEHGEHDTIMASVQYWQPRVAASFGTDNPERFRTLKELGLRRVENSELRAKWASELQQTLKPLGLAG